jgi:hypothetical protein
MLAAQGPLSKINAADEEFLRRLIALVRRVVECSRDLSRDRPLHGALLVQANVASGSGTDGQPSGFGTRCPAQTGH